MYDFVDRPVIALDHGGRFLIWTLRNWVKALTEGQCPAAAVGPAFAKWNMIGGLPAFHQLLLQLNSHGLDAFSVAPVECRRVAEHEAIFLGLVNGLAHEEPAVPRDTLALLVEEDEVSAVYASLLQLGAAMRKAGIFPGKPSHRLA